MSAAGDPLPPEEFASHLKAARPTFGFDQTAVEITRLSRFLSELDHWRRKFNLTGRLSPKELVEHTLESLLGAESFPSGARVVDIGTGGGFPGVPLAIHRPDLSMTWLEPRGKRAAFLRHISRVLPVENVQVLESRIENLPAQAFDGATARGVRIRPILADAAFLRAGGTFLVWTTFSSDLGFSAPAGLNFEQVFPVAGSRERVVARFRRG